jgi:hypothetical protein
MDTLWSAGNIYISLANEVSYVNVGMQTRRSGLKHDNNVHSTSQYRM